MPERNMPASSLCCFKTCPLVHRKWTKIVDLNVIQKNIDIRVKSHAINVDILR